MEDAIPSLSSGVVGSRFVSQDELDTAKARRQEQWKAAYARCAVSSTKERVLRDINGDWSVGLARSRLRSLLKTCSMDEVSQKYVHCYNCS